MQCLKQKKISAWLFLVLALISAMLFFCTTVAQAQSEQIPLAVRRLVLQAQELLEQRNYTAAAKVLEQQRQQPQHHYLIDFTLGNIYLLSEQKELAIPYYQAVVQQRPHHGASWLNLAQCLYATAQYEQAAQAFQAGYANPQPDQPAQPQLLYNAALCYLNSNKPQLALPLLRRLLQEFPAQVQTSWHAALVQIYLQLDQPLQAVEQLELLVQKTSADEQRRWRAFLVQQYMVLKLPDKAFAALQDYIADDGLEARWWQLLTHLHLEGARYPEALVTLKVLAYLRPLSAEERQLLADLHLNLGVPAQAVSYYQQLYQQNPHDKRLLGRLAQACLNLHQSQQALYWTQQGDPATGESADVSLLQLQAQLLFSLKRYAEAAAIFGRVAELERLAEKNSSGKDSGAAWLMQGYAAWNGELWQQARKAFEQAERYPAQRKRARQLLHQLATVSSTSVVR
ncbi:MAG: tetratricopeptide repeat protein [Desulfuromonas sp.]|nr:tetratricopeptide repeat protein [Desulfuromonas sp.]